MCFASSHLLYGSACALAVQEVQSLHGSLLPPSSCSSSDRKMAFNSSRRKQKHRTCASYRFFGDDVEEFLQHTVVPLPFPTHFWKNMSHSTMLNTSLFPRTYYKLCVFQFRRTFYKTIYMVHFSLIPQQVASVRGFLDHVSPLQSQQLF